MTSQNWFRKNSTSKYLGKLSLGRSTKQDSMPLRKRRNLPDHKKTLEHVYHLQNHIKIGPWKIGSGLFFQMNQKSIVSTLTGELGVGVESEKAIKAETSNKQSNME